MGDQSAGALREATQEGNWDQITLGDDGTSSGVLQVADRDTSAHRYHAFPGFASRGSMLARENTCFNADYYAARLYSAFHGLTGECDGTGGDIGTELQEWYDGSATCSGGSYTTLIYNHLTSRDWIATYFGGKPVPY
jgi:hypothetical protein